MPLQQAEGFRLIDQAGARLLLGSRRSWELATFKLILMAQGGSLICFLKTWEFIENPTGKTDT